MSTVESILKSIQKKNSLNKDDMQSLMQLSAPDLEKILPKISKTRQKKLIQCLDELPYLDE